MFKDSKTESTGFPSKEKVKRTLQDNGVQTNEIKNKEKTIQSIELNHVQIQTENMNLNESNVEVDYDKLSAFLNRIYPKLSKELEKTAISKAFDNYEPNWSDFEGSTPTKMHSLFTNKPRFGESLQLKVSGLSWSGTGSVLAVAFSYQEHDDWCIHETQISFFNINSQNVKQPTKIIEVNSCVTCLSYHPQDPSILAAGTYKGEVLVWNLQKEDDSLFGKSSQIPGAHQEKINHIAWIKNFEFNTSSPYLLVSTGIDGRFLIWNINTQAKIFNLKLGFAISFDHSKMYKIAKTPADGTNRELGVNCFDFSPHDLTTFVLGVDAGGILVCSTISTKPALIESEIALLDPVLYKMERHEGVITSIAFFSSQPFMFLTSGSDKEIRIYNLKQPEPLKVFHLDYPVLGLEWNPTSNDEFISWGNESQVQLFNAKSYHLLHTYHFRRENEKPIYSIVINKHSPSILASGDITGQVDIWKISLSKK